MGGVLVTMAVIGRHGKKKPMSDVASALHDLVVHELPHGVTVRSSVAGLSLQLPWKEKMLSQSSCDIIF
jgi:hypothetical protein